MAPKVKTPIETAIRTGRLFLLTAVLVISLLSAMTLILAIAVGMILVFGGALLIDAIRAHKMRRRSYRGGLDKRTLRVATAECEARGVHASSEDIEEPLCT